MDGVAAELLSCFVKKPLESLDQANRLKFAAIPEDLLPLVTTWDKSLQDLRGRVEPVEGGFYRLKGTAAQPCQLRATGRAFAGTVWGIDPDLPVRTTAADLAAGRDAAILAMQRRIHEAP